VPQTPTAPRAPEIEVAIYSPSAERSVRGTVLGEDIRVYGDIKADDDLLIDGTIEGKVLGGVIEVGEKGHIEGSIIGGDVTVRGQVVGSIAATKVQLAKTALVEGDILHQGIGIEMGTHFDGRLKWNEGANGTLRLLDTLKRPREPTDEETYNVLVLSPRNSVRSILAEAIINREGRGKFHAFSAGSQPKAEPNPLALEILASLDYDTCGMRSNSWREFAVPEAPNMDFIIAICDSASGEPAPVWPGHPLVIHWSIPDPGDVNGTLEHRRTAFHEVYRQLADRFTTFASVPIEQLSLAELRARL